MNHHPKYLGHRICRWKFIVRIHADTTTEWSVINDDDEDDEVRRGIYVQIFCSAHEPVCIQQTGDATGVRK